jgi:hypothetical protein
MGLLYQLGETLIRVQGDPGGLVVVSVPLLIWWILEHSFMPEAGIKLNTKHEAVALTLIKTTKPYIIL